MRLMRLPSKESRRIRGSGRGWRAGRSRMLCSEVASAVDVAIAPFSPNSKIEVEGPDLMVSPIMAENIIIALHELLTNSAKTDRWRLTLEKYKSVGIRKELGCICPGVAPDYTRTNQHLARALAP